MGLPAMRANVRPSSLKAAGRLRIPEMLWDMRSDKPREISHEPLRAMMLFQLVAWTSLLCITSALLLTTAWFWPRV